MSGLKVDNYIVLDQYFKDKNLFIFDFDGTIADTERYQWDAYNICLSKYNIQLNLDYIKKYIGHTEYQIYAMIKEDFNIDFDNQIFFNERIKVYLKLTDEKQLQPFNYFNYILNTFKEAHFVILSSQKEEVIQNFFAKWDIAQRFEKIISVIDQGTSKETVLNDTMKFYGFTQKDCILFEDTNRNLTLGKENDILTVGILHKYNQGLLFDGDLLIEELTND